MTDDISPILNIAAYRFVEIADPPALVTAIRAACEARSLKGTVLVAGEGINVFLAGQSADIHGFLDWLSGDPRFADIEVKFSESQAVPFGRLRVKHKREIITFRQDGIRPIRGRAPSVDPTTLKRWLDQGCDDDGREVVLVDTRNAQESAHGSFAGALTLPIIKFTELGDALETHRSDLADKTIVSFCTGGIRCEKAAIWMNEAGYGNVLQLEGGILGYFEQVGGDHYDGGCFVFDQRVVLTPELAPVMSVEPELATAP
ncbi:MAG: sulfurtransferase [Xanthomonadales bacterium]|nr:sulfurtransferase [Xanthomonadales bacterium]